MRATGFRPASENNITVASLNGVLGRILGAESSILRHVNLPLGYPRYASRDELIDEKLYDEKDSTLMDPTVFVEQDGQPPEISVFLPVYDEEPNLVLLHEKLTSLSGPRASSGNNLR